LGCALDLLVSDAHHPASLAFQYGSIARDLEDLATSLKTSRDLELEATMPELTDRELLTLEGDGDEAQASRRALAARLKALQGAGAQLSDRLSMRHFSHTDDSQSVWT